MQILGLDVSKSSVSACLISSKPDNPRQFYYECPFYRFSADAKGIKEMLALKPDIAVMEPTGVNYARLWGTHLARAGIEVRLVGHKELRSYRAYHLALPDKDDDADALALACYGLEYFNDRRRFVQIRDQLTAHIRELVLRLAHLNQFAIRNSQFAITFCNGDLTPTQNVLPSLGRGLKPPKFVKQSSIPDHQPHSPRFSLAVSRGRTCQIAENQC
jgi:hypothetical protein